jgi:predicted transcriptional regulator
MESEPNTSEPAPTFKNAGEAVSLIDRFESAYNEIDALMRKLCKLNRNDTFSAALTNYESRFRMGTDSDFLRSAAELRNVLIHRRTLPIFQMASPTKEVVERLETIRDRMLNPPKVSRYMNPVATVSPDDSLADVMRIVFDSDFSQFPVMNGKEVTGLLTENGITRWLARKVVCEDSLVESADAKVSDLVMSEEKRKNFIFVSKKMAIAEVREKFRRNGLLEAALITESGKSGEKLLGMINRWDLIEE